jgi:hypothetical protein
MVTADVKLLLPLLALLIPHESTIELKRSSLDMEARLPSSVSHAYLPLYGCR